MPYATVSDVRALAPYVPLTRDSTPSEGVVETWIADVESLLNSTLAAFGYQVPLVAVEGKTTDAAVRALKQVVAHAVMAMVLRARPNPESDPENFQKRYDAFLRVLRDPNDPYALPDVIMTAESVLKESTIRVSSNLSDLLDEGLHVTRDQVF